MRFCYLNGSEIDEQEKTAVGSHGIIHAGKQPRSVTQKALGHVPSKTKPEHNRFGAPAEGDMHGKVARRRMANKDCLIRLVLQI